MSDIKMIEWEKPNGTLILTNDAPATVAECKRLKWKLPKAPKAVEGVKDEPKANRSN